MRRFARNNGLSLFFGVIFVVTLVAQSLAGQHSYNAEETTSDPVGWWAYVTSPHFGAAVMENWQSEFLQFSLFIGATIWLVQKGSNESKQPDDVGLESDEQQRVGPYTPPDGPGWARAGGVRRRLYGSSLLIVMTGIFFAAWSCQSLNGWRVFNEERRAAGDAEISWGRYLVEPDFWEKTLENWQSEFLAVGTMAVFTIYLRQRGSPESKPVGARHDETGSSG